MSLLNLLHQSVVLKFTEAAKPQYDPGTGYVFRLVGVDAMGFLQLQDLRLTAEEEHETISEPYWINKDLVLALYDYASASGKDALKFSGGKAAPAAPKPAAAVNHESPAPAKAKRPAKAKAAVA
jgi:hypothetical protein